ncbi:DUF1822 family protein [Calothrix sp. FACHB-156]|nr:DUF1822 family protein [Calothrix sp. FACHB-156]
MTDELNDLWELAIPFPIPASFRQKARTYASQYFTQVAQERIYFNTLAVLIVDAYFRLLGFETNLAKPERWNAAHRIWSEANEIELPRFGNLECCVITTGQRIVIPLPESLSDRIGYLFVEIASSEKEAKLIGFLPTSQSKTFDTEVTIADLQSMDDLIDYLVEKRLPIKVTYLRNWLNNIYEGGWEPSVRNLRTATCKKKLQLKGQVFEIQLSVSQSNELISVRVNVQGESGSLPVGMQVSVPDESDVYTKTANESADPIFIPLEFSPGEEFWVELRLGKTFIREYFIA